jgi:hypothetical protein
MEESKLSRPESDRSDDEKHVHGVGVAPVDLGDDPDAHLSDAERAEIVSHQFDDDYGFSNPF